MNKNWPKGTEVKEGCREQPNEGKQRTGGSPSKPRPQGRMRGRFVQGQIILVLGIQEAR